MTPETEAAIRAHAITEYPKESCGLIIVFKGREKYIPCRNAMMSPMEHFKITGEERAEAEDMGDVVAYVHSHPNMPARPSEADKVMCEASGLRSHIVHVSVEDGAVEPTTGELVTLEPQGYEAPYTQRQFVHGVMDCYALVKDYYKRDLGIELPEYDRDDKWWDRGQNLYLDNFAAAGCVRVDDLQVGDIILMQVKSKVPNHAGVYLGDGLILHHVYNRLSSRDIYDGYWQEVTVMYLRHKERM